MKLCEITNQTQYYSIEKLESALRSTTAVNRYAFIVHDKDTNEEGEPKAQHFHCMIEFKSDSWTLENISKMFDIPTQYIEKAKTKGKTAYKIMCEYLIHKNDKNKYQYDKSEIESNFNVVELIEEKTKEELKQEKEEENEIFINDCVELIKGETTFKKMAIKYGRDFMRNWRAYKEYAEIIQGEEEENGNY